MYTHVAVVGYVGTLKFELCTKLKNQQNHFNPGHKEARERLINRINEFENLPAFHSFLPLRFVAAALLPFYVSCYTALQFYRVRVKLLLLTLTTIQYTLLQLCCCSIYSCFMLLLLIWQGIHMNTLKTKLVDCGKPGLSGATVRGIE